MTSSPLPWSVEESSNPQWNFFLEVGKKRVGEVLRRADADFIVSACNSHAALVAFVRHRLVVLGDGKNNPAEYTAAVAALCLAGEAV